MKALKLKSSTKKNPIWGETKQEEFLSWKWEPAGISQNPTLFNDHYTIGMFKENTDYPYLFDVWELVTVKITIE